jgi:hypothetical protein
MKNVFLIFIACILFICGSATADQCAYIDANTRSIAYNILKSADAYIDFCAPCRDSVPIENKINNLEYKKVDYVEDGEQFYQIYINDKPKDIAYIYVDGKNLGMSAGCKPSSRGIQYVPEYIDDYLNGKWTLQMDD